MVRSPCRPSPLRETRALRYRSRGRASRASWNSPPVAQWVHCSGTHCGSLPSIRTGAGPFHYDPLFECARLRCGDQQFPPVQDGLSLVVCHRVHIEVAGHVVEPLNVVVLARTPMRIAEALLEVEGWDGLAIQRHLHLSHPCQGLRIQGDHVLDLVRARQLGIKIIGVEAHLTVELGKLSNKGRWALGKDGRIEPFRSYA